MLSQWLLAFHLTQTLEHCVVAQHVKRFMRLKLFLLVRVDRWRSLNESAFDMILLFLGVCFSHASRSGILGAFSFLIEGLELVDSPKQALL